MKPNNLFNTDDRAVSPVIGVILMVAITVILAAVIGTFVLGLGDSLGDSQPSAQLTVDSTDLSSGNVTIAHGGGDPLEGDDLRVTANGTDTNDTTAQFPSGQFSVGNTQELSDGTNISAGTTLRIIHEPSESIIFERTL